MQFVVKTYITLKPNFRGMAAIPSEFRENKTNTNERALVLKFTITYALISVVTRRIFIFQLADVFVNF